MYWYDSEEKMSIVKLHNKKYGVTYVYESTSYWDKEKRQPRNKRKLIGKLDPQTGELIPTRKRSKTKDPVVTTGAIDDGVQDAFLERMNSKDKEIAILESKIIRLELRCKSHEDKLGRIRAILGDTKGESEEKNGIE